MPVFLGAGLGLTVQHFQVFGPMPRKETSLLTVFCKVIGESAKKRTAFNACVNIALKYYARDSQLTVLSGNVGAWQEATRFLFGCVNPPYFGLVSTGRGCKRGYASLLFYAFTPGREESSEYTEDTPRL